MLLKKILFVALILLFLAYAVFQMRHLFFGSNLTYNYKSNQYVNKDKIDFSGHGERLKRLIINDEKIFLKLNGDFSKEVYLYPGKNTIHLEYTNSLNKTTKKNIIIFR